MYIFHDESGIFVPTTKQGSFSVVTAYVLSDPQYRDAREVLRRHKVRNGFPINTEFKRSDLKGAEEPYFRFLEDLAKVGGILVAVGSDVSGNTNILEYQKEYERDLINEAQRQNNTEREALGRKLAADVRGLKEQEFTELACRIRLGWEVVQRATGYYAQRAPGALRRREWHYDQKGTNSKFDAILKSTMLPLWKRHAFADPFQLIREANYKHFSDALVNSSSGRLLKPRLLLESIQFVDSKNSEGVQLADLLANGLFGVLNGRFKERERAATLLGQLMAWRKDVLLLPTMNYSNQSAKRTIEIKSIMETMRAAARPVAQTGFPSRKNGDMAV
jgi:hypothetical protein